jgi:hypothetical protein
MLHWYRTIHGFSLRIYLICSLYLGHLKCDMVLLSMHLHPHEIKFSLEHFCRSSRRITTTTHRYNGLDRKFDEHRDYASLSLHLLMAVPSLLWYLVWEQRRLQEGWFLDAIKWRLKRRESFPTDCSMYCHEQHCAISYVFHGYDQSCIPSTLLLLSSIVHQVSLRVQAQWR